MSNKLKRFKEGKTSFLKGGDGEPFLLLHGIPGSAFTWESTGMHLADRYQVIIPDLLGYGQSDIPEDDYYFETQARGIKQLLDKLGINKLTWQKFERHLTPSCIDFTRQIFQRSLSDLKANYQSIEDMLSCIEIPTLIFWGKNDPFFATSVGERTQRAIHGSALKIYERTGHFVPEEQPSGVASDIMEFFGNKRRKQ